MICPYRKKKVINKWGNKEEILEEFLECYKEECPFYEPNGLPNSLRKCKKEKQ